MDISRIFDVEDMFCNLFVLAGKCEIKKDVFTRSLESHIFCLSIEKRDYSHAYEMSVLEVFNEALDNCLSSNDYENVVDDYYWVGKCYFYIQSMTHKSFSYIFLKLPFEKLYKMYNPYHEVDFGNILDMFFEFEKEETIIKLLCKRRNITLTYVSKKTSIPISTLRKYRLSDEHLYKASFYYIYLLTNFFVVPETLFLKEIPQVK